MKMQNKKRGFTIVELVIVIAVIAILAGVLVPTFTGIVNKAKTSARQQQATSTYHAAIAYATEGTFDNGEDTPDAYVVITEGGKAYYFAIEGGEMEAETTTVPTGFETNYEVVTMEETIDGVAFYKSK